LYWEEGTLLTMLNNLTGEIAIELSAPSVRTLQIFDITQVTTTEALQFRHVVLGPG